ncbi:MAG: RagB/SusD family nutrient uptake outer membrane protein [Saprospiraceae bacterium]|nr:RagB/SusD family nutrient uptake outer membrane protein [Saprospiraceae bacterium]
MKNIRFIILSLFIASTFSCEKVVEGSMTIPTISLLTILMQVLLLKGIELANISVQVSHQNRIVGMWSGQTTGAVLYKSIYEYNLSAEETDGIWQNAYQGVVKQARLLREHTAGSPKAAQLSGIAKVLEANAMGTIASYFGDVPYSGISNDEILDPVFQSQKVFAQVQTLLDGAITDLASDFQYLSRRSSNLLTVMSPNGAKVAHTLKARLYLYTREYDKAYQEALKRYIRYN